MCLSLDYIVYSCVDFNRINVHEKKMRIYDDNNDQRPHMCVAHMYIAHNSESHTFYSFCKYCNASAMQKEER